MADQASNIDQSSAASAIPADKGKGKSAIPEESDVSMMDEDEQSEESEQEQQDDDDDEEEGDDMAEIDTDNIVSSGRRTRGKVIDFAKAAEESKDEIDEDDEEDDDDFEAPDEEMEG